MWVHFEIVPYRHEAHLHVYVFSCTGTCTCCRKGPFRSPMVRPSCRDCVDVRAICWMLQAWLPPSWALFGGFLAIVHLGLFSYWINSYTGAGSLAALGGALVLGGLPRFMRKARIHHALLMALGVVLLAYTRPFEGLVLCAVVAVPLCRWILFDKGRPSGSVLLIRATQPLALLILPVSDWLLLTTASLVVPLLCLTQSTARLCGRSILHLAIAFGLRRSITMRQYAEVYMTPRN